MSLEGCIPQMPMAIALVKSIVDGMSGGGTRRIKVGDELALFGCVCAITVAPGCRRSALHLPLSSSECLKGHEVAIWGSVGMHNVHYMFLCQGYCLILTVSWKDALSLVDKYVDISALCILIRMSSWLSTSMCAQGW